MQTNFLTKDRILAVTLLSLARGFMNYKVGEEEMETILTDCYDLISKNGLTEDQKSVVNKMLNRAESLAKRGE